MNQRNEYYAKNVKIEFGAGCPADGIKVYFEVQRLTFYGPVLGQKRMRVWKTPEDLQILRFGQRVWDFGRKSSI